MVLQEGTAAILAAGHAKEEGSDDAQEAAVALMHDPRVTRAWCALQFVSQSLKAADVAVGPFLAPHLLSFLPSMLKLQVCGRPCSLTPVVVFWLPCHQLKPKDCPQKQRPHLCTISSSEHAAMCRHELCWCLPFASYS